MHARQRCGMNPGGLRGCRASFEISVSDSDSLKRWGNMVVLRLL